MPRARIFIPVVLLFALLKPLSASAGAVRASDYSSFWIWGGVRPQPCVSRAQNLYILQGQVSEKRTQDSPRVIVLAQGLDIAHLRGGDIWLVYRANTMKWPPEIVRTIIARLQKWRLSGNSIVGLQIDFDVKTRKLPEYVEFLKRLRTQLPADYKVSITGLLDWTVNGDIEAINQLKGAVDEITVQTYQGRKTIADYHTYLPKLRRLVLPFKIGLIQHGEWEAPGDLESNPWFRGYVIFLQNEGRVNDSAAKSSQYRL